MRGLSLNNRGFNYRLTFFAVWGAPISGRSNSVAGFREICQMLSPTLLLESHSGIRANSVPSSAATDPLVMPFQTGRFRRT